MHLLKDKTITVLQRRHSEESDVINGAKIAAIQNTADEAEAEVKQCKDQPGAEMSATATADNWHI